MRAWLERYPALAALLAGCARRDGPAAGPLPAGPARLRRARGRCCGGTRPAAAAPSGAARRSASASSWSGSIGSASPSSPTPSASALFAVPAVLLAGAGPRPDGGRCRGAGVALRRWRRLEAQALAFAAPVDDRRAGRAAGSGLQFPWNPIAIVWAVSDATLQAVAWLGTYGLSLVTVAAAAPAAPLVPAARRARPARSLAARCSVGLIVLGCRGWRLHRRRAVLPHDRRPRCGSSRPASRRP